MTDFSLTFLAEALSIDKSYVRKEMNTLIEQNVILVVEEAGFNKPRKLQINSDVNAWMVKKSPQWRNTATVEQKEYSTVEEKKAHHRSRK